MIAGVLAGTDTPLRPVALLAAAAWLWLAGRADTPQAGLAMAIDSLESGRAHALLLAAQRPAHFVLA